MIANIRNYHSLTHSCPLLPCRDSCCFSFLKQTNFSMDRSLKPVFVVHSIYVDIKSRSHRERSTLINRKFFFFYKLLCFDTFIHPFTHSINKAKNLLFNNSINHYQSLSRICCYNTGSHFKSMILKSPWSFHVYTSVHKIRLLS